jgi:hypothetical protein
VDLGNGDELRERFATEAAESEQKDDRLSAPDRGNNRCRGRGQGMTQLAAG